MLFSGEKSGLATLMFLAALSDFHFVYLLFRFRGGEIGRKALDMSREIFWPAEISGVWNGTLAHAPDSRERKTGVSSVFADFFADLHQQFTQVIFADSFTHSPVKIAPVIAFD
jgi:hypothetical protein